MGGSFAMGLLIPTLPLYLTETGMSLRLIGFVLSGAGLGAVLGSLPVGMFIRRYGPRAAMGVVIATMAVTAAALGLTEAMLALLALRMVFGMSATGMRLAAQSYIRETVALERHGRSMAYIGGSNRIGLFLGAATGGVVADKFGFESAFLVAGIVSLVALLGFLGRQSQTTLADEPRPIERPGLLPVLRQHKGLLATVTFAPLLVLLVREGRQVVLPLISDDLGMSISAVGYVTAISAGVDMVLFPIAGFLMDRFGRLWGMVPAFGLMGIGMLLLAWAWQSDSVAVLVAGGVVIGIGNGLSSGSMLTLGSDVAPLGAEPEFLAWFAMMQDSGRIVGPILVGWLAASASLGASALALAVVSALVIFWLIVIVGETRSPSGSS